MLSTSPQASASSPGPTSSQSSSSGSYYSSSVASSRHPASSGASSGQTSPPIASDRSNSHQFSPATKGIHQAQDDADRKQRGMAFHRAQSDRPFQQQQSSQQLGQYPLPGTTGMSQAIPRYESGSFAGWNAVPGQSARADETDSAARAGMIHNFGTSPEANREPVAKTRRTSSGGSRASGDLYPTNSYSPMPGSGSLAGQSSEAMIPGGSSHGSQWQPAGSVGSGVHDAAAPSDREGDHGHGSTHWQSSSSTFEGNWQSGSGQFQAQASQGSSQIALNAASLSPRTCTFDARGKSPVSSAAGASSSSAGMSSEAPRPRHEASPSIKTPQLPKMNLATFPPQDLLKVLSTLLHEIATANDEFRPETGKDDPNRKKKSSRSKDKDRSQGNEPEYGEASQTDGGDAAKLHTYTQGSYLSFNDSRRPSITTAALSALATPSSTLCFHARNVPSISIESYLLRILKYCPTTNEVFLSLLVYFDRMSRMGIGAKPGANGDGEIAGEAAGLPRATEMANMTGLSGSTGSSSKEQVEPFFTHPGIRGFAIDSYNVHRLVIAGVTVASKFFSDVFYTNSRYAKVGGLPVHELNQLELQFLLLNDFRLTIPLEEMQRYADQLLMYGSGRPENVGRVKELGVIGATASAGSRKNSKDGGGSPSATRDSEGDVRMRDS